MTFITVPVPHKHGARKLVIKILPTWPNVTNPPRDNSPLLNTQHRAEFTFFSNIAPKNNGQPMFDFSCF